MKEVIKVEEIKLNEEVDYCEYSYVFSSDDFELTLYQAGNLDVYLVMYSKEKRITHEMLLSDKNIDYAVLRIINDFYNEVLSAETRLGDLNLVDNEYIRFLSDEYTSPDIKLFNEFRIKKIEDGFILEMNNYGKRKRFSVALNTNRGHNRNGSLMMLGLLRNLKDAFNETYQIHIDDLPYIRKIQK